MDPSVCRVYMEKQRADRRRQAAFAKKQAEIGKWRHLVVSPSTDSRWAKDAYFYPINERDYTHEEVGLQVAVFSSQSLHISKCPSVACMAGCCG